jgi:hypothetical protein
MTEGCCSPTHAGDRQICGFCVHLVLEKTCIPSIARRVPFAGEEYHNWWLVMLTSWCPTFNALRFLYTVYTHSFLSYTCENGQHGYLMESSASLKATQYFNMTNAGKSRSTKEHETHNRHVMISVCNPARRITVNGSANCLIQSAILNHKDLSLKSVRIGVEMQKLWGIKVKIKPSRCRRYQLCRLYVTVQGV